MHGRGAGDPESEPYLVALLEDHALVADGLANWIAVNAPDFQVVTVASTWDELINDPAFPPHVVIMAYQLGAFVPIETRVAACLQSGVSVVVMSSTEDPEIERRVLAAGAAAYVSKERPASDIIAAARYAVLQADADAESWTGPLSLKAPGRLNDDELAVLRLYANGHSTVDIALIRGVKFEHVRAALKRIRRNYEGQDRRALTRDDLVRRAAEDGYLQ